MHWKPEVFETKRPYLEQRSRLIRAVRGWFEENGFLEVETPILQVCPVMDTHIHGFATDIKGVDLKIQKTLYLHTSPEFAMKKLLVAGLPKIFQLCHVFRNGEGSRLHSPEFTMLEWYRAGAGYRDIMDDCIGLLRHCAKVLGIDAYRHRGRISDPFAPWRILSVEQAFRDYAGIELGDYLGDAPRFNEAVKKAGIRTAPDDSWDDLFFRVMAEKIEPYLGDDVPCILHDYPVCMASLARRKPEDPRYAERFEMYVCGIELCNAFGELTDAKEQKARFHEELGRKAQIYGESYPVDEDFIAALEYGMPESGGNALGIDRLVMLAIGADSIQKILWQEVVV